tara:strand:- start:457 stop:846 length:390 start_codon:yes stop_codon:yes gene_type:complete
MSKVLVNTFDIDGVIYFGEEHFGVRPCDMDIIITGRSFEQREETEKMLESRRIYNRVMYNPLKRSDPTYSREASGKHKAETIKMLQDKHNYQVGLHFEDDPIQIAEIKKVHPDLQIIHLVRESEEHVKY